MRAGTEGGRGEDVLAGGAGEVGRHQTRRRQVVLVAIVLVVGLVAGYYVRDAQADLLGGNDGSETGWLSARITGPHGLTQPYPPYRLVVTVHNDSGHQLVIREASLRLPGFRVGRDSDHRRPIPPGKNNTIIFRVEADCAKPVAVSKVSLRLRVRTYEARVRSVSLRPRVQTRELRSGHAILCAREPPFLAVQLSTLQVTRASDGLLRLKVKLSAVASEREETTGALRLLYLDMDIPGVHATGLPVLGTADMPVVETFSLSVGSCSWTREPIDASGRVWVSLLGDDRPYLTYAHTDTAFGVALREYIVARCGVEKSGH